MTIKNLIFSADPTIVDTLFFGQIVGPPKYQRRVMEKLYRFLERVRDIDPEETDLIGLVVDGHFGPEMTVFSKREIENKYEPNNPMLTVENVYKLPHDEARELSKTYDFTRYLITDMPWEQALGIEVDPGNIAVHGVEYAACDVICSMTYFGFSPEERIQRMKKPRPPYGYSQAYLGNPTEYHIPLYTKVAEYREIHHYMQRRKDV